MVADEDCVRTYWLIALVSIAFTANSKKFFTRVSPGAAHHLVLLHHATAETLPTKTQGGRQAASLRDETPHTERRTPRHLHLATPKLESGGRALHALGNGSQPGGQDETIRRLTAHLVGICN